MDELGVGPRPTASRIYTYEPLPSVFPGPRPHGPHKPNLVGFTSTFAGILTNILNMEYSDWSTLEYTGVHWSTLEYTRVH